MLRAIIQLGLFLFFFLLLIRTIASALQGG